jgi:hydrogenase maturation protein HypF
MGVFVEIQGEPLALDAFQQDLLAQPPPLARIEAIDLVDIPVRDEADFVIVESQSQPEASTPISPDIAICDACLTELFTPTDRRYRYSFINCTHCGPRFTILRDIPYDRPMTTMAGFSMCQECKHEYDDPQSRRFHAQPNACPRCGPQVRFLLPGQQEATGEEAIRLTVDLLASGAIVAVKGIGGFHLACDATCDQAVQTLRQRKRRTDKPFAVLFASLDQARRHVHINDEEARLLTSREHPIVLLRRRDVPADRPLSALVAPGNHHLGVLLPYSPLHHLLVGPLPLIFTSGNLGDEPIVKDNDEALARLKDLADAFLLHDRDIHVVADDSVVRVFEDREYPIRRSRGYAPLPVTLGVHVPTVLAVGGELKSTFCLTRDDHAYQSQHIGDMENLETLHAFEHAVAHFEALFRASPGTLVCDQHPDYLSSRWAEEAARQRGARLVRVQHHHAHVASLMAEHGRKPSQTILGICFDGTGYGTDGAIWGGEVLLAGYRSFERLAHLRYTPLPGGDACVRRPYRTALAHLFAAGIDCDDLPCTRACSPVEQRILGQQLAGNVHCVPTSSMGRLFDAVASLLGIRQCVTYEAQAAIEMETLSSEIDKVEYPFPITNTAPALLDPRETLRALIADQRRGTPPAILASRFHQSIAKLIAELALLARERTGIDVVGLTGGVFQNVLLVRLAVRRLRALGFEVLLHHRVPANDGGLALGQAAIACLGSI